MKNHITNGWVKKKKETVHNEEELSAYFQNKYFNNREYFKTKYADDDPLHLTKKLYNEYKDVQDKRKEDYVIFHEYTYKAYYEHKDDLKYGENRHIAVKLLYDFRHIILVGFLGLTAYGLLEGFSSGDDEKEGIKPSDHIKTGKGLHTKILPLNVV